MLHGVDGVVHELGAFAGFGGLGLYLGIRLCGLLDGVCDGVGVGDLLLLVLGLRDGTLVSCDGGGIGVGGGGGIDTILDFLVGGIGIRRRRSGFGRLNAKNLAIIIQGETLHHRFRLKMVFEVRAGFGFGFVSLLTQHLFITRTSRISGPLLETTRRFQSLTLSLLTKVDFGLLMRLD